MRPGYYECTIEDPELPWSNGQLICLYKVEGETAWYLDPDGHQYRYKVRDILPHLRWIDEEEAQKRRAEEMAILQKRMREQQDKVFRIQTDIAGSHKALTSDSHGGADQGNENFALQGPKSVQQVKQQLAEARFSLSDTQLKIREIEGQLRIHLKEQELLAETRANEITLQLKQLEEVILMVNLYLGKDEEIVHFQTGTPAPAELPISFRQRVLYMDEECGISAEEGGLDIHSIGDFDEWLKEPGHLEQILPEEKGVVALRVRRTEKKYANDPWVNANLNEGNERTYFLIRNGENLYRLWNTVSVSENLFPVVDEYAKLFKDPYDGSGRRLKPGSSSYYRAMEKAQEREQHFMRILLLLQGLIDRTPVFHPTPEGQPRLNLADPASITEFCRFIRDNENLLDDGRPRFHEWLKGINSNMHTGMRICGAYGTYSTLQNIDKSERMSRRHASLPKSHSLMEVEKYNGRWSFLYDNSYSWSDTPRRARFYLESNDDFFICFDNAQEEDLHYYLHDRGSRDAYLSALPLIRTCLILKAEEREAEEPFINLVFNKIQEKHQDTTKKQVAELVQWWKTKNKHHRAIAADDAAAYKMVLKEYELKAERESVLQRILAKQSATQLLEQVPNLSEVLLFAHKRDRDFVALRRASKRTHFVHEELYHLYADNSLRLKDRKEWVMPDGRNLRWHTLHEHADWAEWPRHLLPSQFLTDPQLEEAAQKILAHARERLKGKGKPMLICQQRDSLHLFFAPKYTPEPLELGNRPANYDVKSEGFSASLQNGEVRIQSQFHCWRPCIGGWKNGFIWETEDPRLVWVDRDACDQFLAICEQVSDAQNEYRETLENPAQNLCTSLVNLLFHEWKDTLYQEYLAEGGHPEMFNDRLKSMELPDIPHPRDFFEDVAPFVGSRSFADDDSFPVSEVFPESVNGDQVVIQKDGKEWRWPKDARIGVKCVAWFPNTMCC